MVEFVQVTATSVVLSWSPPPAVHHNGLIRLYLVLVLEQETGRNFTRNSSHTQLSIGELHPFYTYHFAVSAVTVSPGPSSDYYTTTTFEDGECFRKDITIAAKLLYASS